MKGLRRTWIEPRNQWRELEDIYINILIHDVMMKAIGRGGGLNYK